VVVDLLPRETAIDNEGSPASVLDNSADASAKGVLQSDALDRALQEVGESHVLPIVPAHEPLRREGKFVSLRSARPSVGVKGRAVTRSGGPALLRIGDIRIEVILGGIVAL